MTPALFRILSAAVLLALTGCGSDDAVLQGYVEGDFVDVAPEVAGRVVELPLRRGSPVKAGDLLVRLDDTEARAVVAEAEADLARAVAERDNLQQGQRPTEIAVLDAQIAEAQAALDAARRDFERQQALFQRHVSSAQQLDQAQEALRVSEARVATAERQRDVARMPARTPEIEAAERAVEAAAANLDQAKIRLGKYEIRAASDGRIEERYMEPGEVASSGTPVLSLLPDGHRKVVLFVPEPALGRMSAGTPVAIACDGCAEGLSATVDFVAREAEYTPPVIFSRETRGKLVYRAEAALTGAATDLPLGQPVDIVLAKSGSGQ